MNISFKSVLSDIIYSTIPGFILDTFNYSKNRKDKLKPINQNKNQLFQLDKTNFLNQAFNSKYILKRKFFNNFKVDKKLTSLKSYVPFVKNKTNILIFNYLSMHYGVRDPVLCELRIIDDNYDYGNIQFFLKSNEVININLNEELGIEKIPELGKTDVYFYHPRIPKNIIENQIRFFGIYKNEKGIISSGVHSMPLLQNKICAQKKNFIRNFGDRKKNFNFLNDNSIINNLKKNDNMQSDLNELTTEKKIFGNGYYLAKDLSVKSIWHDADQ